MNSPNTIAAQGLAFSPIMVGMPHRSIYPAPARHYNCERFTFGDRWRFGIECEVQDSEVDPWGSREPFGSFWFWIGGQFVGNPHVAEQLIHAFTPLIHAALTRKSSDVPGASHLDKLDFIRWRRFGEDDQFEPQRWGNGDIHQLRKLDTMRFEVIPAGTSPFQDGWEAALFQDADQETFVWRPHFGQTYELSLPLGEITNVLKSAGDWFRSLRSSRVTDVDPASQGRPILVHRSDDPRFAGL